MYDKKDNETFTTNNSINWKDKINYNWDPQNYYNWCPHLLPCGLCARTDRPCPKSKGNNFEPIFTWSSGTIKPIKNNINGTFTTAVGDKKDE